MDSRLYMRVVDQIRLQIKLSLYSHVQLLFSQLPCEEG